MKDLAPSIYRQRAVIEGFPSTTISSDLIKKYLAELSDVLDMQQLIEPVTHRSDKFGEAGWVHWESSGAHFYAWEQPVLFFSVDIYTCKEFKTADALNFTRSFFDCKSDEIVYKDF